MGEEFHLGSSATHSHVFADEASLHKDQETQLYLRKRGMHVSYFYFQFYFGHFDPLGGEPDQQQPRVHFGIDSFMGFDFLLQCAEIPDRETDIKGPQSNQELDPGHFLLHPRLPNL